MDKKQFLILLGTLSVAFFLGAFLGTGAYLNHSTCLNNFAIFHHSNPFQPVFADDDDAFTDINKMIENQQKQMNEFKQSFVTENDSNAKNSGFVFMSNQNATSNLLKMEELENCYKITINLKSFNNDENNVKIKIHKNKVNILAKYKNKNSNSEINQTYYLPKKVNQNTISKVKKGSDLIITIPKEK
jgi:HSP20 family molecular chaperone IbpA